MKYFPSCAGVTSVIEKETLLTIAQIKYRDVEEEEVVLRWSVNVKFFDYSLTGNKGRGAARARSSLKSNSETFEIGIM